jgi:hypothetical protein
VSAGNSLSFWLSYVESRGGLWEPAGDSTLVMVPPELQRRLDLPEEFAVTEHPDVAREDGAALLAPGHPLLNAAAQDVLSADDAGVLTLASPTSQPPDDHRLLAKARDQFPVDHGRIDASEPATRGLRQVLRVGALVTYTASADEAFHERSECWVDVPSRQELPQRAVAALARFIEDGSTAAAPDLAATPAALAAAHRLLDEKFSVRCRVLAGSARDLAEAELARAQKYYAEALVSLGKRQANAAADRQALLAARADNVRAEQKRRLAEIEDKYAARYEIRPYRLHLLLVPSLRLPVDVLRGTRRFPLVLDWMLPAGEFAPVCCPGCGADAARWPLVAAKTQLGCTSCLPGQAVTQTARPPAAPVQTAPVLAAPSKTAPPKPALSKATSAQPAARPVPPAAKRKPPRAREVSRAPGVNRAQDVSRAGEKLAMEFWSVAGQGNLRALRRLCAAGSPAGAAIRLYGTEGPARAVGLATGEKPENLTTASGVQGAGELAGTGGYLYAGRADYPYLLRWDPQTRLVCEVLPFGSWVSARLPSARWLFTPAAARMFGGLPEPDTELDPVALRLWRKALPVHGIPLTLRCLAAWWRIDDGPALLDGHRPSVLAAAIHRMVGYRAAEAGVTHDAIADLYKVAPADTRAITPLLQNRLRLAPTQPW